MTQKVAGVARSDEPDVPRGQPVPWGLYEKRRKEKERYRQQLREAEAENQRLREQLSTNHSDSPDHRQGDRLMSEQAGATRSGEAVVYVINSIGAVVSVPESHPAVRIAQGVARPGETLNFGVFRFASETEIARYRKNVERDG
jgi:hypothetical protein